MMMTMMMMMMMKKMEKMATTAVMMMVQRKHPVSISSDQCRGRARIVHTKQMENTKYTLTQIKIQNIQEQKYKYSYVEKIYDGEKLSKQ